MTVQVKIINGKYRIVEDGTDNIAVNKNDKPLDGGGHDDVNKAIRQAGYINVGSEFSKTKNKD